MALIKILCEPLEKEEDIKEQIIKAFTSDKESKDSFADPIAEELYTESDSWFNFCISNMFKEIFKEMTNDNIK